MPIDGAGVVVLGGTAGVGLESAARFAEQGARVIVLGRDDERGAAACDRLRERVPQGEFGFVKADARNATSAEQAEAICRSQLGAIDVLMCTTGPSEPPRLLHDIAIERVADRLNEIILPPIHMMHATLGPMREQNGGSVIVVASDAAKVATPGETLVGAAMAALLMFSRAAALEAKREGVRINVLTPSLIADTPGASLIAGESFSAKMFQKAASMASLGVAESADLASMALYLASPAARRITGQAISINGGISVA